MRKLLALALAMMLLCTAACAEHTVTHHLSELRLSMTVPGDYIVQTEDAPEGLFDSCDLEKESTLQWLKSNDTYMVIFSLSEGFEIDVSMAPNDIASFNDYGQLQLEAILGAVGQQLETTGVVFDGGEYLALGEDNYLRLCYRIPDATTTTYAIQYYTIQHNQAVNFRLFSYGAEHTEAQKAQAEAIMNTVVFD